MAISKKTLNHALEFFTRVSVLTDKTAVLIAVNELLEQLSIEYKINTLSTNLAEYRKYFEKFIHENPDLNETVNIKNGTHTQHCAVSKLILNDKQKAELIEKRKETSHTRDGFDKNGEIRELDLPKIDIAEMIKKSCECLLSDNPLIIASGIVNLTGLRANEQNMPRYNHTNLGIIERQMVVLDEFVIGFEGLSKKQNDDDVMGFYARPTLAPAKLIVDAQNKYLSYRAVQGISTDINTYQKTFQQQFRNEYKKIFGKVFSTIDMFDEDDKLTRENGTPHRGRAFYACALRGIIKAKTMFPNSAISTYIQLSLVHDSLAETMKYFGRYDESLFINPVNINLPTNINKIGKMNYTPTTINIENKLDEKFNIEQFIASLSEGNQRKITQLLIDGIGETQAVLALVEYLSTGDKTSKSVENNVKQPTEKKKSNTELIEQIVEGVMHYNRQNVDGDIKNVVVPGCSVINKICELLHKKQFPPRTMRDYLDSAVDLNKELESMGIVNGLNNTSHNGKYHRKTSDELVDTIVEYI